MCHPTKTHHKRVPVGGQSGSLIGVQVAALFVSACEVVYGEVFGEVALNAAFWWLLCFCIVSGRLLQLQGQSQHLPAHVFVHTSFVAGT
jgi:hypothetical protein